MEIRHRIFQISNNPKYGFLKQKFEELGCQFKINENGPLSSIEYTFSENAHLATLLLEIIEQHDLYVQSALHYDEEEIMDAEWVIVQVGEFQYPQPSKGYIEATYNTENFCRRCGQGLIQDKPFRLKKDFVQNQSKFLGLFWVGDEIFIRPVIKRLFENAEITGIAFTEVLHHRTNEVFNNTYQMKILKITEPGLITKELSPVTCKPQNEESFVKGIGQIPDRPGLPFCGRVKYHYPLTKPIVVKSNVLENSPDFVKSYENFGSGAAAFKCILARNKVVRFVKENKLRGLGFPRPVHLV